MPAYPDGPAAAVPPTDLSTPTSKDLLMRHTTAIQRLVGSWPSRLRRLVGTLAALGCLSIAGMGLSTTAALAEDCPNAALRAENNSTRLPECRAYETVIPPYTEGYEVTPQTYSDDGDRIAYTSIGTFAGNESGALFLSEYLATRSTAGWTSTALTPPETTYDVQGFEPEAHEPASFSTDLRSSVWTMSRSDDPTNDPFPFTFYLRSPDGVFTRVGNGAFGQPLGGAASSARQLTSADLSHLIFNHDIAGSAAGTALYEFVGTENPGLPLPVSVDNTGTPTPGETCSPSTSPEGRVIVFTSGCNGSGRLQVWARVGASATVAVSASDCTRTSSDPGGVCDAPADAHFGGMAADGSRVFFTTTQQLVNGDTDQTNDLYECDIPPGAPAPVGAANACVSLTEVSGSATGADVENVVHVSEDGSRVYFVATGVLAGNLGTNDAAAVAGDNNLYVWEKDATHPAGQTTFVAKLESNDILGAQTTADGRFLLFDTANRLLASDTDEAYDVYRYDADTGTLLRLSIDSNGSGGNEPGAQAFAIPSANRRPHASMTDDGNTVVFETTEALSPIDTDGASDVYEWHDGQVSLISKPGGGNAWITGSGQDIFIGGYYDARIDGGFPVSTSVPCSGEACQGAPALQPPAPGAPASAAFNGPASPPAAETPPVSQPKPKPLTQAQRLSKALKACRSKHNRKKRAACEKQARKSYRRAK